MELNNIIFSFFIVIFGYFFNKYLLIIFNKSKFNFLIDNDYKKPQAFHENATQRLGGITIFLLFFLTLFYLYISQNFYLFEYISFCTLFFILGLLDDLKIRIAPKFRLGIMIIFLLFLIVKNGIYIEKTGLEFLNHLLKIDIFSLIFISLCFLFIINGSNLIDGYNGLLAIHSLIIFASLFLINLLNENINLAYILFFITLINLIFLKFNFPKAQMFLGDSGAYLIGSLIALTIIKTSISNSDISPFFFCILLFYLFFEVFFSFFRKIFTVKQSPLFPDDKHLHMLFYKFLLKKNKTKLKANYETSVYINVIYLLLTLPAFIFMENGFFCKYYFLFLLVIYFYFYKILKNKLR